MSDIIKREAKRTCYCRGCDKEMERGTPIVYKYSWRNQGQNIMFCMECATKIGSLVNEDKES